MLTLVLVLFVLAIVFEIIFNITFPKDSQKFTVGDYLNMINRDKTRNMKGRINNPFKKL